MKQTKIPSVRYEDGTNFCTSHGLRFSREIYGKSREIYGSIWGNLREIYGNLRNIENYKEIYGRKRFSPKMGIHHRGVQWEGGAVDWGSII